MSPEELDEARAKEAQRLWESGQEAGSSSWVVAARLAREGWTPPEPVVDPDVLAFREWAATNPNHPFREEVLAGKWDRSEAARGFVAGARMAREQMPSLTDAVEWIAENNDEDLGNDDDGYQIIVELVAALFGLELHDVVYAVTLQRAGCSWSLDDIRARDPAAPAKYRGEA